MKKRTILALLITVFCIVTTNKSWYQFKPMPAGFSIQSQEKAAVETLINKKENDNYNKPLKVQVSAKFDFKLLIIITVLSFLLAYKLSNYIADFKTLKNQSRIDIIFLTLFFIMLFIPMSHINQEEKSVNENRYLAKWKPLVNELGEINYNFGKDFDNWFNDRFNFRNKMLYIHYKICRQDIKYNRFGEITYLNKKNNYIFTDNIWESNNNWTVPDEDEYNLYYNTVFKLLEYTKSKNMKLYILAIPTREKVLIKYEDPNIKTYQNIDERISYIKKYLEQKFENINIIYPLEELTNYSGKDLIYYKTDHHYTDIGALEVAKTLFNSEKIKLFDNYKYTEDNMPHGSWDEDAFKGSLYNKLNMHDSKIFDVNYKYFDFSNFAIRIEKDDTIYKALYSNPFAPNNKKVYLIGDSFIYSMGKCLSFSFRNLVVRRDNINKHKLYADELIEDINKENPEIVIFVYAAPHIDRFLKTFYKGE